MSLYDKYEALKIERRGRVLVLTMDNPPTNAMTPALHYELTRIFFDINFDEDVGAVVITGSGEKGFSAGGDIKRMAKRIETHDFAGWNRGNFEARQIIGCLLRLEKPLIARINGHAMGLGATLAVYSDLSYMMAGAKIADTHVKVGLAAGDGGAMMWPLLMGFTRARRYLLTGDAMTGREAAEFGLVTEAVDSIEQLDECAFGMAERLANGASRAVSYTKMATNLVLRKLLEGMIESHLGLETYTFMSDDHREATTAFRDKREPKFTGQ